MSPLCLLMQSFSWELACMRPPQSNGSGFSIYRNGNKWGCRHCQPIIWANESAIDLLHPSYLPLLICTWRIDVGALLTGTVITCDTPVITPTVSTRELIELKLNFIYKEAILTEIDANNDFLYTPDMSTTLLSRVRSSSKDASLQAYMGKFSDTGPTWGVSFVCAVNLAMQGWSVAR